MPSARTPRTKSTKCSPKTAWKAGVCASGSRPGGCSGYEYTFAWEKEPRATDGVFVGPGGARIFVDPKSYGLLHGTELDYDTSLMSRGFQFNNPNAKSTCGCGLSFNA